MAEVLVGTVRVLVAVTDFDQNSYSPNDEFEVHYDDVADEYTVDLNGSDTNIGPLLLAGQYEATQIRSTYCDDGTRVKFTLQGGPVLAFPYFSISFTPNFPGCGNDSPVCDLAWSGIPAIVNETALVAQDGSITVLATSSNGQVKYDLFDFDYENEGQVSGTFSGLGKGLYKVYAKDPIGCEKMQLVNVFRDDVDTDAAMGPKYRLQYDDLKANKEYAEIWQRQWINDVIEVSGGAFPIGGPSLRGENRGKLQYIVGSQMNLGFLNEGDVPANALCLEGEPILLEGEFLVLNG